MNQREKATYHLYGRTSYTQPLEFLGTTAVAAGDKPDLPDGSDWVEVIAFPQRAIVQVIPRPTERTS